MESGKVIKIGLLGAGTVGSSLIRIIEKEKERILRNHGFELKIHKVGDRSYEKKEFLRNYNCTKNLWEVVGDPEIQIIVELIGGISPAGELVIEALQRHKSVVTANKALLANQGRTIFEILHNLQQQNIPVSLGFEASVGAALPIIKNLRRIWSFGKITSLYGILNGTCNFILTKMEEGWDYEKALKLAQELGFAEADPSFDVSGKDAGQKLAIISSLGFSAWLEEKNVQIEGIENIHLVDHQIAEKLKMKIRLIALAKLLGEKLLLRVHPVLIPKGHLLTDVKNELNALIVNEEYSGSTFIVGKGAGGYPTASAVLADIISIASGSQTKWFHSFQNYELINDAEYRFYLRFQTVDRPGVLAAISRVLADFQISIASMHQEEGEEPVNVVILTHVSKESAIKRAVEIIDQKKDIILAKTTTLRLF
ncbi:MAG: homoserine dehydrogenase [Leptospiraceae bacterium]|nr:homoserine dehydrogenase [Leptospiraceae bacterium]MDW7974943.1 homoserine dehydrogenase [Leptospiraceae bacterium]